MKKRIQKRTDHIRWFKLVIREADEKRDRLMKAKSSERNQDEINRLEKTISDSKEEVRRYSLALTVHGNFLTALV